jgi:hypothetical protein
MVKTIVMKEALQKLHRSFTEALTETLPESNNT